MTIRNLEALFSPRSIALIGASNREGTVGEVVARNLLESGFAGPIMFVNRRAQSIRGRPVCPDISALPNTPDLAIVATPADGAPTLIEQLAKSGCRAAIVLSAGFGAHDSTIRTAILDAARPALLRVVGPNCLGIQSPSSALNASFAHLQASAGKIALVSQSGAILAALLDWAAARGIGFSRLVSLGDMLDVDFGDMLDFLALDAETDAILLYIENVTNAHKFMSAARIAARGKPVIVIKSGRSEAGARAATTHTGALAGADLVYDAAFRRAGMLRVHELSDLFDAAELLASGVRARGDQLTIVTNGGGAGVLATDELEACGGRLTPLTAAARESLDAILPPTWSRANPVDIIGDAGEERYRRATQILLSENQQDAVLVMNCPTGVADSAASAAAVADVASASKIPLLTCWLGDKTAGLSRNTFETRRIPTFETPTQAVRAFMMLVTYQRNQAQLLETPAVLDRSGLDRLTARAVLDAAIRDGRAVLTDPEAKAVLAAYGVPVIQTFRAETPEDAAACARAINGPVALKIYSPDISHKSDVGGVALNLTADSIQAEAKAMLKRVADQAPTARLAGFTVQRMVDRANAVELLTGLHADPTFGPTVLFGAGGVAVEVLADRAMAIVPLNTVLAGDLINRTRVSKLLAGYRNVPPANRAAIERILVCLSDLAVENPEISALDINPLLANDAEAVALDARIALRKAPARRDLAITPYPSYLSHTHSAYEGDLQIRPIRPEDELSLIEMAARCSAEDLRFRFQGAVASLTHMMAARLSQIDYDREMAFVASAGDSIVGVAHMLFDPDFDHATFAILVRSDRQGRGIGAALMTALLAHAKTRGAASVTGDAMVANIRMLALARDLGAQVHGPDTPDGVLTLTIAISR